MAFEDKLAELEILLDGMQDHPVDKAELHQQILQKLNELRAYGMPLPEDLVRLEESLGESLEEAARRYKAAAPKLRRPPFSKS